jgi:hypothetical protein
MKKYRVLVVRDATEFVSVDVEAEDEGAAESIAEERASTEDLPWRLSDEPSGGVYACDSEEIIEGEE